MKLKRSISILFALILICTLLPVNAFAASASFSLSGTGSVTVGNQVKVTVSLSSAEKIGSWRFSVNYDPSVLEYVSGADSGGGGAVSFADSSDGTTSFSKTITFRTKKIGDATVSLGSAQVVSFDTASNMTVNSPSKKISVVAAPNLSGENQLSELSVSTGELNPVFAAGTTSYAVAVPYEVTSLSVYAKAKDSKAKVSVSPSDALVIGENKIDVVVTAENGSKRTYTITVTRTESELAGITVNLNDATYNVAYDPATLTVPEGYTPTTVAYGEKKILVFSAPKETLQIAYLSNEESGAWYIYDSESQKFSEYLSATGSSNSVVLLTPAEDVEIPEGFLPHDLVVGEKTWPAYENENSEEEGIWLVYGMNSEGDCEFFYYDSALATFTSYFKPVKDKAAEEAAAKENASLKSLLKESEQKADQMEILFLGSAALATLLLICLIISLATRKKKDKKQKNKKHNKKNREDREETDDREAPSDEDRKNVSEEHPAIEELASQPAPEMPRRRRARRTIEEVIHKEAEASSAHMDETVREEEPASAEGVEAGEDLDTAAESVRESLPESVAHSKTNEVPEKKKAVETFNFDDAPPILR